MGRIFIEHLFYSSNIGRWVYAEKTLAECIDFDLTHGQGGGHKLAVDVALAHAVRVNDGQMTDSGAYKALGAPGTNTAYAEYDYPLAGNLLHYFCSQKQL